MRIRRLLLLPLIPLAATLLSGASSDSSPTPVGQIPYLFVNKLTNNDQTIEIIAGNLTEYAVDLSGLAIDAACAQKATLSSIDNVRVDLLTQGCAKIIGTPANTAEANAQASAIANKVGMWAPHRSPRPNSSHRPKASVFASFVQWITKHKLISIPSIGLLLTALASPWLLRFAGWLMQLFLKRKVQIVIAGAVAAGKTGLWIAWKDEYSIGASGQISNLPATAGKHSARLEPIMLQKWTLHPTLIDAAGAEPEHVLQGIRSPRGPRGVIARRRTKRVLLCVVAPCSEEATTSGNVFDESYVSKQEGYMHLPMAILRQRDAAYRPDLAIMFATKFDLLSSISPRDSDGKAVTQVATAFRSHRQLFETACTKANVPFVWIVGSARRSWGLDELRKGLAKVIANA